MRKATGKPVVCGSSSDDQSGTNAAGPGPSTSASRATIASSTSIVPPRPEVITLKRKTGRHWQSVSSGGQTGRTRETSSIDDERC